MQVLPLLWIWNPTCPGKSFLGGGLRGSVRLVSVFLSWRGARAAVRGGAAPAAGGSGAGLVPSGMEVLVTQRPPSAHPGPRFSDGSSWSKTESSHARYLFQALTVMTNPVRESLFSSPVGTVTKTSRLTL